MAKRRILEEGDPTLRTVCRPIDKISPRILTLIDDMIETMRAADGVGLAGPQVGVLRRVVVVETEPGNTIVLINPRIIASSGEQEGNEGCLSLPGQSGIVRRPMNVTVSATGRDGLPLTVNGSGLTARAFCHEIDHLDGILYTDIAISMNEPDDGDYDDSGDVEGSSSGDGNGNNIADVPDGDGDGEASRVSHRKHSGRRA